MIFKTTEQMAFFLCGCVIFPTILSLVSVQGNYQSVFLIRYLIISPYFWSSALKLFLKMVHNLSLSFPFPPLYSFINIYPFLTLAQPLFPLTSKYLPRPQILSRMHLSNELVDEVNI